MEKFGIFELLDALSALTAHRGGENDGLTAPPDALASDQKPDKSASSRPADPPQTPHTPSASPAPSPDALSAFLARHDRMSRKAEHKK